MLSDTQIRAAKASDKPLRLYDERGLYLEITPSGGRWWRLKYRFGGKEKLLSMGTYPDTGLKAARDRRDRARELLAQGVDPSVARRAERDSQTQAATNSFEVVAREWHATVHAGQVSTEREGRNLHYRPALSHMNALLAYLTDHCCLGQRCAPSGAKRRTTC